MLFFYCLGNDKVVDFLIKQEINLNLLNNDRSTALNLAITPLEGSSCLAAQCAFK